MRNLCDLNHNPLPYSIPVILRPLPAEIIEGEHFVITNLQHLVPGSSSSARNPETEVTGQELVISIQPRQPSLAREDSNLAPQALKKGSGDDCLERHPLGEKEFLPCPLSV